MILEGTEIKPSAALVGSKIAFQTAEGGPIFVSPAMYDLIFHADKDELRRLGDKIMVKQLWKTCTCNIGLVLPEDLW